MNLSLQASLALAASLLPCLALGCGGGGGDGSTEVVVEDTGVVALDWTVDGVADPAQCDQGAARNFDVLITDMTGRVVGEYTEWCSSFLLRVELDPGTYQAHAVLLDAAGADRTTTIDIGAFTIYGGDELAIPIDFPADSFY